MFEHTIRRLQGLSNGVKVPLLVPLDDDGYWDRLCPGPNCGVEFKVFFTDWKDKVSEETAFCPVCRRSASPSDFNTPAQNEYIRKKALSHVQQSVNEAFQKTVRSQRPARGGLISLSLTYKPAPPIVALPPNVAESLRQKFTCEACGCRYAAVGAAFFCHACGHNSAISTFQDTVTTVRTAVASLPQLRDTLAATTDTDTAARAVLSLVEDCLCRGVAAFQRLAEALVQKLPGAAASDLRRNVFQNLKQGSQIWRQHTGQGYEDILDGDEMAELIRLFQQRHLLMHRGGLVDKEYLQKSGDTTYCVGQRLVIRSAHVLRLFDLLEKLAVGLRALLPPGEARNWPPWL